LVFFNIRVLHDDKLLDYYKTKIHPEIDKADIILLEYPAISKDEYNTNGWFATFAKYAKEKGKVVDEIDFHNSLTDYTKIVVGATAGIVVLRTIIDSFEEKSEESVKFRTYFAGLLGLDFFSFTPKSEIVGNIASSIGGKETMRYNFDLKTDGRTIFMLLRILKTIKDNPGKKILVVTGDAHAEMFEVYSKNETEREFKIKSFLYEIAYKPQKLFAEITTIK
jgi:hypothetical protein